MKIKSYLSVIVVAVIANSCAPAYYYQPDLVMAPQANTFISNGVTYVLSNKGATSVALAAIKAANSPLQLSIVYLNNSIERADAIPDSIKIMAVEDDVIRYYQVYNADQYISRLQRRQNFALAMKVAGDSYNNYQAGYTKSTTNAVVYSPNGGYSTAVATTTTYDAGKVAMANAMSLQQIQQAANSFSNYNQSLSQQLIRSNTLIKGKSVAGYLIVNTSNSFSGNICVDVPFGGEDHKFYFSSKKIISLSQP